MTPRRWRVPERLACVRCGEEREAAELDRILWCDDCRRKARRRAAVLGRVIALGAATALAVWIALAIHPSDRFLYGWAATVAAAYWLGSKAAREIVYGVLRMGRRPARRIDGLGVVDGAGAEAEAEAQGAVEGKATDRRTVDPLADEKSELPHNHG